MNRPTPPSWYWRCPIFHRRRRTPSWARTQPGSSACHSDSGPGTGPSWATWVCSLPVRQVVSSRAEQVPPVAGDVEEHGDAAVRLGAGWLHELDASGRHPRVCRVEVLHPEEEPHPPAGLVADGGGLAFPSARASSRPVAAPGGRTTTHRLGCPPPLVRAGESSTSSKPSAPVKKPIAGSYSLTTTVMRSRCTAPA